MILIKKLSRIDKDLAFCFYNRAAGTYRRTWGLVPTNFSEGTLALFQAIVGGQITLTINCYSQQDFSTFRRPYCAPTFFRGIDIIDNRQEA